MAYGIQSFNAIYKSSPIITSELINTNLKVVFVSIYNFILNLFRYCYFIVDSKLYENIKIFNRIDFNFNTFSLTSIFTVLNFISRETVIPEPEFELKFSSSVY